jgi:hypothetical protein
MVYDCNLDDIDIVIDIQWFMNGLWMPVLGAGRSPFRWVFSAIGLGRRRTTLSLYLELDLGRI